MTKPARILRIRKLHDQDSESDLQGTTPAERIGMMWQLTLDAWAFKGEAIAEPRLSRHVVRIVRREG
jgi:hypothetical protein